MLSCVIFVVIAGGAGGGIGPRWPRRRPLAIVFFVGVVAVIADDLALCFPPNDDARSLALALGALALLLRLLRRMLRDETQFLVVSEQHRRRRRPLSCSPAAQDRAGHRRQGRAAARGRGHRHRRRPRAGVQGQGFELQVADGFFLAGERDFLVC